MADDADLSLQPTTWLLERIRGGRDDAMNELLRRVAPRIQARVRRKKSRRLDAVGQTEDFAQDIALELLRYLPQIEFSDSRAFERWLGRVIENSMADWGRRVRSLRRDVARLRPLPSDSRIRLDPPVAPPVETPSKRARQAEEEGWVRAALTLLDPEEEELFLRIKLRQDTYAEVARDHRTTPDAIRMRTNRIAAKVARIVRAMKQGRFAELVRDDPASPGTKRRRGA